MILKKSLLNLLLMTSFSLFSQNRTTIAIDHWKFSKGDHPLAAQKDFDDSQWQEVTVPHDWAIYGPFDKEIDKQIIKIEQNNEEKATEKQGVREPCLL